MLRNYLTLTLRTVRRQAGYVGMNVTGLALGLAACLLIGLFVRDELSYDRFHGNADRIVRVNAVIDVGPIFTVDLPDPAGPYLTETRPEVESFVRVKNAGSQTIHHASEQFEERGFLYVDPNFFDIFSFEVLRGDASEALGRPGTILITPDLARRYFGDADPIGQVFRLDDGTIEVEVAGLIAPPPANSILQFQAVLPFSDSPDAAWDLRGSGTYLLLRNAGDVQALEDVLPDILVERYEGRIQSATVEVEPFTQLYLHAERRIAGAPDDVAGLLRGSAKYVYAFSIAAFLILLVACVNYVNLATARASERAQEVGVRKAVGARRGQLVRQFLFEAAVLTILSLLLAAVIVELLLPHLNALTDKSLDADYLGDPMLLVLFGGVGLVVTLLAGLFPAVYLASFRPVAVLRNASIGSPGAAWLRRGLVAFQFAVSAGLVLCAVIMHQQLDFLHQKELGFESEQVIQLGSVTGDRYPAYKQALLSVEGVRNVTIGAELPGGYQGLIGFSEDSPMKPEGSLLLPWFETDFDLLETLDLRLVSGRYFDPTRPGDADRVLLLNEAGARAFGWTAEEAAGQVIRPGGNGREHPVIGVVEDFHAQSPRYEIQPLALRLISEDGVNRGHVFVRVTPDRLPETLEAMKDQHAAFFDDTVFTYTFLDDAFAALFEAERRLRTLVMAFSILALVIAALGVLGLVAHAAQRRTKEIGIRKVLGATERSIVGLLSKELLVLVGVGFAVAAPFAYVGMQRWLEEFAYRIDPGAGLFLSVGAGLLLVALVVAGSQALRAARTNPADALRYE